MDDQAFKLLMQRFDRVDKDNKEIKSLVASNTVRISSLETTRVRQRTVMAVAGTLFTGLSGVVSWIVSHVAR